jgi:alpha-mannosidase
MGSPVREMFCGFRSSVLQLHLMPSRTKVRRLYPGCQLPPDGKIIPVFHAGKHEFSWAVLPHRGHFLESHVPIAAYLFNSPLHGEPA